MTIMITPVIITSMMITARVIKVRANTAMTIITRMTLRTGTAIIATPITGMTTARTGISPDRAALRQPREPRAEARSLRA